MAQQHMNINIPADQLEDRLCVCGNAVHVPAVSLKAIPALYSPSGNPETMILQTGFICAKCGAMMTLRPVAPKEEESGIEVVRG